MLLVCVKILDYDFQETRIHDWTNYKKFSYEFTRPILSWHVLRIAQEIDIIGKLTIKKYY